MAAIQERRKDIFLKDEKKKTINTTKTEKRVLSGESDLNYAMSFSFNLAVETQPTYYLPDLLFYTSA